MRDAKTLNLTRNIVSLQVLSRCFAFSLKRDQLVEQKNICCGLKKCSALIKLVDLPEREQICCMTICGFHENRATKPKIVGHSRFSLYFSQQLSSTRNKLLRDKLITQGEKRETSTQNLQRNNIPKS